MPSYGYSGPPGSGKSYEVVKYLIVPALAIGRRVVTNIPLKEEAIREYISSHKEFKNPQFGEIVQFRDDQLDDENCYPHLVEIDGSHEKVTVDGNLVHAGDLFVYDEAQEKYSKTFLSAKEKQKSASFRRFLEFLSQHRHMTHATKGYSTDSVFITQNLADLATEITNRMELTYRVLPTGKNVGIGSIYRCQKYNAYIQGAQRDSNALDKPARRRRDKEIFALYKGYMGSTTDTPTELSVDGRQNILANKKIMIGGLLLLIVVGIGSAIAIAIVLHGGKDSYVVKKIMSGTTAPSTDATSPNSPVAASAAGKPAAVAAAAPPKDNEKWRIAGRLSIGSARRQIILADTTGRLRLVSGEKDAEWEFGDPVRVYLDSDRDHPVTRYSGALPSNGPSGIGANFVSAAGGFPPSQGGPRATLDAGSSSPVAPASKPVVSYSGSANR